MSQSSDAQQVYRDLLARTLDSVRIACEDLAVAYEDLSQVITYGHNLDDIINTSHGTALIHELRTKVNEMDKLLPWKY